MNPIETKIREAGGIILREPLLGNDGEINPKCADDLFSALERYDRRQSDIWKAIKKSEEP